MVAENLANVKKHVPPPLRHMQEKKIEVKPAWIHKLPRLQQNEKIARFGKFHILPAGKVWKIPNFAGKIWKIQDLAGKTWKIHDLVGKIWKIQDLAGKIWKIQDLTTYTS